MLFAAALLISSVLVVNAIPNPTEPSGSSVFAAGSQCTLQWEADPDGKYKTMNIQFMCGPNNPMVHMRTIATVDGTTAGNFSWECPKLDLYSQVYFYQFTAAEAPTDSPIWSTRFTITDTDGTSVAPPETLTASDGSTVGYGTGHFLDKSLYNAFPSYLAGNGQIDGGKDQSTTPSGTQSNTDSSQPTNTPPASETQSQTDMSSTSMIPTTTGSIMVSNTATHKPDGAVAIVGATSPAALLAAAGAAVFGAFVAL